MGPDTVFYLFIFFGLATCGIFPNQGWNPCPLHWEHRVLTTEPPGKSPSALLMPSRLMQMLRVQGPHLACVCACAQLYPTLQPHRLWPARLLCPWNFPGRNTGSGCCYLLPGIFPIQRSNPCLLCLLQSQVGSLPAEQPGTPSKILNPSFKAQTGAQNS